MLKKLIVIALTAGALGACAGNGGERRNDSRSDTVGASERAQPARQCRRPAASGGVAGSSPAGSGQAGGTVVSPVTDCDVEDAARAANASAVENERQANAQRDQAEQAAQMQREASRQEMERMQDSMGSMPQMPSSGGFRRF